MFVTALRAVEGGRRGSSRPIVVETEAGACLVKLRGAAQGTGPLVAEIIVAEIAESLGLSVPARYLVELGADVDVPERDAELRDLMAASVGVNLGFAYLAGARDLDPDEIRGRERRRSRGDSLARPVRDESGSNRAQHESAVVGESTLADRPWSVARISVRLVVGQRELDAHSERRDGSASVLSGGVA